MDALPQRVREDARRLRCQGGLSFAEIASALNVSSSTARRWTLDIRLSAKQIEAIDVRKAESAKAASDAMAENSRRRREVWQLEGRARARQGDPLHLAGCLLYWAEGSKNRNTVTLVNSDVHLIRLFRRFLLTCFEIGSGELVVRLHVYLGNDRSLRDIEDYWLEALRLPRTCLRGHSINKRPSHGSGIKINKLPFGVCRLQVLRSTWLMQHIYGAIQEYGEFEEPRWLD